MGCSSIDVEELSRANIRELGDKRYIHYYVNNHSLEQIDKDIRDCQSTLKKLNSMSSSDYTKQLQIIKSKAYMNTKLTCLFDMREIKLNLIKAEEIKQIYDRKINQLIKAIEQLRNIFPKNYFLSGRRKDEIVPSDWEILDFNWNDKYEDERYLSINNNDWVKAFHGTGRHCKSENEIFELIDSIAQNGFKNGFNNVHANCDDIYHPGKKIGIGVYVTPNINTAKSYAGIIHLNGEQYFTVFMVKVKKSAIRKCNCPNASDYWVVNGSSDEIRTISALLTC